ncbi:MAG: glycosyltransferase, partial [Coriobacteriaceae bacterium]|nr:glycosyltransferase [Coriobacteriaceae bacterium]
MHTAKPSVSVVVPVFNGIEYLRTAIDSLLAQTLQDLEIIAVDDGSTDECGDLLDRYAELHPDKLRVIHTENRGAWEARLAGIRAARGRYVGFCDSDDVTEPEMFAKMLHRTEEGNVDLVVCAYQRLRYEDGALLAVEMTRFGNQTLSVRSDPGFLLAINTANWNKLFKANLFNDLLEFDTPSREAQDSLLHMMTCLSCDRIAFMHEPLYRYRVRKGSLIEKSSLRDIEVLAANIRDIRADFVKRNKDELIMEICDVMALTHIGLSLPFRQDTAQQSSLSNIMRRVRTILDEQFPLYLNTSFT